MEVKIENIVVNGDQIEAVIKLKAHIASQFSSWNIVSQMSDDVVNTLTREYLRQNMTDLLGKVDEKAILNSIVLNVADKVVRR